MEDEQSNTKAQRRLNVKEIRGDLFNPPHGADAICLTTNGMVKRDGSCVMGRGCAAQAKTRWPGIEHILGSKIMELENHVHLLTQFDPRCLLVHHDYENVELDYHVVSFPVKHHWRDQADLDLIKRSANELMSLVEGLGWARVILPRPGCGNGRLGWGDVQEVIQPILDDRVSVIHFPKKRSSSRSRKTRRG